MKTFGNVLSIEFQVLFNTKTIIFFFHWIETESSSLDKTQAINVLFDSKRRHNFYKSCSSLPSQAPRTAKSHDQTAEQFYPSRLINQQQQHLIICKCFSKQNLASFSSDLFLPSPFP